MKTQKTDFKKVGLFLKGLDKTELIYLSHCLDFVENVQVFINRNRLTKAQVCEIFKINPAKYNDFIKGNYNYSLLDISRLNAASIKFETEKLQKSPVVKAQTIEPLKSPKKK